MKYSIKLTVDPLTHRALYDSEAVKMGEFATMQDAELKLGELLNFCSIATIKR